MDITVEMVNSRNIKLCHPYKGFKPTVLVKPNEEKIIVYEATDLPYSTQMRIISSFKKSKEDYLK